jgi:chromosome segregation ATPase
LAQVGSTVIVKGHTRADHDHAPSEPSYSVTLIRGKSGQSPTKDVRPKSVLPSPVAIGPTQINSDDERVERSKAEVHELQELLAAARKETAGAVKRCASLEVAVQKATAAQKEQQAALVANDSVQSLDKALAEVKSLREVLAAKSAEVDQAKVAHTKELRRMQDDAAVKEKQLLQATQKAVSAETEVGELRARVLELETSLADLQAKLQASAASSGAREVDSLRAETEKLKTSEKELTVALRTMSQVIQIFRV